MLRPLCAKFTIGIQNQFVPLITVPMNLPLSRVTIGPDACTTVEAARDVAVAAQIVASNPRRKVMVRGEDS